MVDSVANLELEYYKRGAAVLNESKQARGAVTAPGAGAAIATIVAPPAGLYRITVIGRYGGTSDTTDNMELKKGATSLLVLPVLAVNNGTAIPVTVDVRLDGATAITVNAIAAGAALTNYLAYIVATKVAD